MLERELRDRTPAHFELGARGSGSERARRAAEDVKAPGEGQRLRIGECHNGEIVKAHRAAAQADGFDILQTEPSVAGRHRLGHRATDQLVRGGLS